MQQEFTFHKEKFRYIYQEMYPLLEKHYREVAHYQDIKLNPDYDRYCNLEEAEVLHCYTVRDDQYILCGYALFFVNINLHYSDSLQAAQDVIFIHPEKRGFGRDFIKWCDEQLKSEGVQVVRHHIKAAHNWGKILERDGYELEDLIYAKRLDK